MTLRTDCLNRNFTHAVEFFLPMLAPPTALVTRLGPTSLLPLLFGRIRFDSNSCGGRARAEKPFSIFALLNREFHPELLNLFVEPVYLSLLFKPPGAGVNTVIVAPRWLVLHPRRSLPRLANYASIFPLSIPYLPPFTDRLRLSTHQFCGEFRQSSVETLNLVWYTAAPEDY